MLGGGITVVPLAGDTRRGKIIFACVFSVLHGFYFVMICFCVCLGGGGVGESNATVCGGVVAPVLIGHGEASDLLEWCDVCVCLVCGLWCWCADSSAAASPCCAMQRPRFQPDHVD